MSAASRQIAGLLLLTVLPGVAAAEAPAGGRHALLVGCSRYPNLELAFQLRGPRHDVKLLRDLLVGRFNFPPQNVVCLSEEADESLQPTRANIEREFRRLAQTVQPGDSVVILLAGHGSQQPQRNVTDPDDYEANGLDQIFLPCDVGTWDGTTGAVPNAIVDRELRGWLKAIRERGGRLLVVIDACHSASMVRGAADEQLRQVPMEALGIPDQEIRAVRQSAGGAQTRGSPPAAPFKLPTLVPDLVAIYAAQRFEAELELRLPPGSEDARPHGLLTYHLVQVITQSPQPLTYTELVQRIHARYLQLGRPWCPVPLVEGADRDREFLGQRQWPGRSRFLLKKADDGRWTVNAGALHGLTAGSILAVFPPPGLDDGDRPVGHVRITGLRVLESTLEPCAYEMLPLVKDLPEGGRLELVYTDFGSLRLRVGVDPAGMHSPQVHAELEHLDRAKNSLVRFVPRPAEADWLVQVQADGVHLLPAAGWVQSSPASAAVRFGPVPVDGQLGRWLSDHLGRIARARNLLALAAAGSGGQAGPLAQEVDVTLHRFADEVPTTVGQPLRWDRQGIRLRDGDVIGFHIKNRSMATVDVTLLFVDSQYGIHVFFPEPGLAGDENRLLPGKDAWTPRGRINSQTVGPEHMVAIVVRARGNEMPISFACLAQPTLDQVRAQVRGNPDRSLDSPLGQLLQNALFAEGTTRALSRTSLQEHALWLASSWQTEAAGGGEPPLAAAPLPAAATTEPAGKLERLAYLGIGLALGLTLLLLVRRGPAKGVSRTH